jgi:hypothetical protein
MKVSFGPRTADGEEATNFIREVVRSVLESD